MSLPELSNYDLLEINKTQGDKTFGGCFSRDDIPLILPSQYLIVNLDSSRGPGTHWVMVDNRRSNECLYFDPYGMPPPERVLQAMHKTGKKLKYSDVDVQDLGTTSCGWWCEYIADELRDGKDFKRVVSFADQQPDPEQYLIDVFQNKNLPLKFNKLELHRRGTGIWTGEGFKPRKYPTKRFQRFLDQEGDQKIVSVQVGKVPVQGFIQGFLNLLSIGKFKDKQKELGYNDIYHNFMLITLENGKTYRVEKNHVVEATQVDPASFRDARLINIPVKDRDLNMKYLISTAEADDTDFWYYDPETKNCQVFVKEMLDRNDLKPETEEEQKEVKPQDSSMLLETLGSRRSIPGKIVDQANLADRYRELDFRDDENEEQHPLIRISGSGMRKRKRKRQLTVKQVNDIVSGKTRRKQTRFSDRDWKRMMEVIYGKENVKRRK